MLWITAAWVSDEADVFLWKAREKDSAMTCFSFGSAARVYPQECKTCTGRCTTVHRSWASSVPQCTPLPGSHTGPVCPVRLLTKGTCLPVQKRKHAAPRETHTDQHSQESSGAAQTGTTHYTQHIHSATTQEMGDLQHGCPLHPSSHCKGILSIRGPGWPSV